MSETQGSSSDDLRAKVFRDREHSGDWRVRKIDDDGRIELAVFSGGDARQRAVSYANREYGEFDEVERDPNHRAPDLATVLDDLRRSGIAATITLMPRDAGYVFTLGETASVEGSADSVFSLIMGLRACAMEHFPDSIFAAQYRGAAF